MACEECAAALAEAAQLRAENGYLRAGVGSTVTFIEQQQRKPTIPRPRLIPSILGRLRAVIGR
jgi:hypothetical protein